MNKPYYDFFEDPNVRFPEKPRIKEDINIYDAPNGLGLQFNGGVEKLIIKGGESSIIWNFLHEKLNGKNNYKNIIEDSVQYSLNTVEVCRFLKTLHSYHLLENDSIEFYSNLPHIPIEENIDQIKYYNRLVGYTGINDSGNKVLSKQQDLKLLIITSVDFIPIISMNLSVLGIKNVGFLYLEKECKIDYKDFNFINIMTIKSIYSMDKNELNNVLLKKVNDYHYVMTLINNHSNDFIKSLNIFCKINNVPILFNNLKSIDYEIGPFFFPDHTGCYNCYQLRSQSNQDLLYDYIYQKGLDNKFERSDSCIKGHDIPSLSIVINVALSEIIKVYTNFSKPSFSNKMLKINSLQFDIEKIDFLPVPGCLICSDH